jgi:hypothetical protein
VLKSNTNLVGDWEFPRWYQPERPNDAGGRTLFLTRGASVSTWYLAPLVDHRTWLKDAREDIADHNPNLEAGLVGFVMSALF